MFLLNPIMYKIILTETIDVTINERKLIGFFGVIKFG